MAEFRISGLKGDTKDFADAKEAGAAFYHADPKTRPYVIESLPDNRARTMADTQLHGVDANGDTRFVKALPEGSRESDLEFRAGYHAEREKGNNMESNQQKQEDSAILDKENRKQGDMASIQQMRVDTARGWTAEQAGARAKIDLDYHTALDQGGAKHEAQGVRSDMAINARENPAYRDALAAQSPAVMQQVQQEAAEALEEQKRREALLARSGAEPQGVGSGAETGAATASAPTVSRDSAVDLDRDNAEIARRFRTVSELADEVKQSEKTGQPSDRDMVQSLSKETKELDAATEKAFGGKLPPNWDGSIEVKGMFIMKSGEDEKGNDVLYGEEAKAGQSGVDYYELRTKGADGREVVIAAPETEADAKALSERLAQIHASAMQLPKVPQVEIAATEERPEPAKVAATPDATEDFDKRSTTTAGVKAEAAASKTDEMESELRKEAASATAAALATAATGGQAPAVSLAASVVAGVGAATTVKAIDSDSDDNSFDVKRKGAELERGEFIMPRRIASTYTEHDGKFFAKDTSRMMFHDKGDTLATSTTDKTAIADMVAYAKAKQWESLKLSGSQEFRREAWLQAESQGIKTQGFTPREKDLVELKTLTMERATNSITPLQDRAKGRAPMEQPIAAPRHDLNKNQAATASAAAQNSTTNIKELQKDPAMERYSMEDLGKIAFYRALIVEREKDSPPTVRDEAVAKFDKSMRDPAMVKALPDPEIKAEQHASAKKEHKRDTPELSL